VTDFGVYRNKLAVSGLRVLEHAIEESRRRNQNYVSAAHLVLALVAEDRDSFSAMRLDIRKRFRLLDDEFEQYVGKLESALETCAKHEGRGIRLSPQTIWLLRRAMKIAETNGRRRIEAADILSVFPQIAPVPYVRPSHGQHV
jgi:ATP-dependent Clp protease ATP-binding subunit ClpA